MQNSIVKVSKCFNIFYTIFTQVLDKIENFEFPRNAQCLLSASLKWTFITLFVLQNDFVVETSIEGVKMNGLMDIHYLIVSPAKHSGT